MPRPAAARLGNSSSSTRLKRSASSMRPTAGSNSHSPALISLEGASSRGGFSTKRVTRSPSPSTTTPKREGSSASESAIDSSASRSRCSPEKAPRSMSLTMSPLQTRNGSSQPLEAFAIAPPEPSGSPSRTRLIARPGGDASAGERGFDVLVWLGHRERDAIEVVAPQAVEQVGEQRAVEDRDELLRRPPRERAQPRPLPADEHYRAHGRDRTRRLARWVSSRPAVILAATWRSSTAVTRENGWRSGRSQARRLSTC